jgi:hypothetical protein
LDARRRTRRQAPAAAPKSPSSPASSTSTPGRTEPACREDPHPGAQLSLFDTVEGKRHTAFTDTTGDPTTLELQHRQRARAEAVIRDTKACGLAKQSSDDIVNNDLWILEARLRAYHLVTASGLRGSRPDP